MASDDSDSRRSFSRRTALQGAAGAISVGVLPGIGRAEDRMVRRVGYYRHTGKADTNGAPERTPVYYQITQERWERVESARDAEQQVRDELSDLSFTPRVVVSTRGQNQKEIRAKYPEKHGEQGSPEMSFNEFQQRVPDRVTGVAGRGTKHETGGRRIPVKAIRQKIIHDTKFDHEYTPIRGGCIFRQSDGNYCTTGTTAYSSDFSENVVVTAGHCIDTYDGTLYQHQVESQYARMTDTSQTFDDSGGDAGVMRTINGASTGRSMADFSADNTYYPIGGVMTEQRLRDLEDIGGSITKQGATEGRDDGTVTEVSNTTFQTDAPRAGGDSGGPYFEEVYNPNTSEIEIMIGGIHEGSPAGTTDTIGTQMVYIEDRLNLTV